MFWTAYIDICDILQDSPFLIRETNTRQREGNSQYKGYVPDLLQVLAPILNFTYEIVLVPDSQYGRRNKDGTWTGLVQQLIDGVNLATLEIFNLCMTFRSWPLGTFTTSMTYMTYMTLMTWSIWPQWPLHHLHDLHQSTTVENSSHERPSYSTVVKWWNIFL